MIDPAWGVPLAAQLVGAVVGVYALVYAWVFAKKLLR